MAENQNRPFASKELPMLLTVDVCDGSFDKDERKSRFTTLMELVPEIQDLIGEVLVKGWGNLMPVTWFIRADMQVKQLTGNTLGLYSGWRSIWDEVAMFGGELGWHPHLYKHQGHTWVPVRDAKKLKNAAEKIWHEIQSSDWKPETCRMGESVGSNELMGFLDSIGLIADSSALPGRKRDDGQRWFDWVDTPDEPYHPVRGEYRRPSMAMAEGDRVPAEEPLRILEVPFTMAEIRAPYDKGANSAIRRYIDLSFDHGIMKKGLGSLTKDAGYVMMVIHPMQAAGMEVPEGGMVVGGTATVRKNLKMILNSVEANGRIPRLMTVGQFAKHQLGIPIELEEGKRREIIVEREPRQREDSTRTIIEQKKGVRLSTKGGVKQGNLRQRDPRKRQGL